MALITELLNQQAQLYPATFNQEEAEKNLGDFRKLLAAEIVKQTTTPLHRICPTCNGEAVEVHVVSEKRAYTLCAIDEEAGRDYFDPATLKQWVLDTPHLLSLFQKALGVQSPTVNENIIGLLWDLGVSEINGVSYHLFFCRNIDEIESPKLSIIQALPRSVVFYTGTPHVRLPDTVALVSFASILDGVRNKSISINKGVMKQIFPVGTYATKEGAIELDTDLVLQDRFVLFEPIRGGIFGKQSQRVRPLGSRIIEHLHGICTYKKHAKTLEELASALGSSKVSISNEIKRIQQLCEDNSLKQILYKFNGDKWGINSELKCCK